MKQHALGILALIISVATFSLHFYQRPKVAYAETSVLMKEFTEAIKARKEMEALQKAWDDNLKILNDSLSAAVNRMKQNYEKASKDEKEALKQNLERWNADFGRYSQSVRKMSQEKESELMGPVVDKLNAYLSHWGKSHGYDLIFGTMTGGNLLQANEAYNVTSRILVDLNEKFKELPLAKDQMPVKDSTDSRTRKNGP